MRGKLLRSSLPVPAWVAAPIRGSLLRPRRQQHPLRLRPPLHPWRRLLLRTRQHRCPLPPQSAKRAHPTGTPSPRATQCRLGNSRPYTEAPHPASIRTPSCCPTSARSPSLAGASSRARPASSRPLSAHQEYCSIRSSDTGRARRSSQSHRAAQTPFRSERLADRGELADDGVTDRGCAAENHAACQRG
jgi:hypothetical protein